MSPTFVALVLLAGFLGFRLYARFAPARPRPIFAENHIFAGRLTEGLLHALISDRGFMRVDTRLSAFEGSAVIVDRDGACGRLVLYPALGFGRESDLLGLRAVAARHAEENKITVVVVGGSEEFGESAFEAAGPLRVLHIGDDGRLREVRRGFKSAAPRLVVESALDRMARDLKDGAFPTVDLLTARSLVGSPDDASMPPSRAAFRGVVTTALTVAIALCFAIEVAISRDSIRGDGAVLSVVYRMGAIFQPAILEGQWQRLIAAPFLHFGLLHLGMNGWAQWSLGAPLEFLVGPWRFLGLWVGSALGASLTSLVFNETSVSAGASGAIFGLLGAFTTFVFFRKDVLPQPVPRPLRNGVLATLVLNLFISFIPGIDMAAHAGGFVTGALMALGIVRRDRSDPTRPGPLRLAVAVMVLLGVGVTSIQERAHRATSIPELGDAWRIGELRLPIPRNFTVSESRQSGLTLVEADGSPASPYSITYKVSHAQQDEEAALRLLPTLRSPEAPQGPSDWVALSRLGIQGLRAIEIVVVAPDSCRAGAEALGAELAKNTR
ncbi:MAG: rhomboid family intramembrane serine protease [Vicinamibacteria bacterium]|nr:rhomboid family intramembrane serine protease [Vicinamibacteria bacterium]